ncbi:MAG: gliding motility-associated C-terminal domain-containing protein [Sediminicola sp.]
MYLKTVIFILFCSVQSLFPQTEVTVIIVAEGNKVVLNANADGAKRYHWYRNGIAITDAEGAQYEAVREGFFSVVSINTEGCTSNGSNIVEIRHLKSVAPPLGQGIQYFCDLVSPTIGNLLAIGESIRWYDSPQGGNPILASAPLEDKKAYYASQTLDGSDLESEERLKVVALLKGCPDLFVTKSVDNPDQAIGQEVLFTVMLGNSGSMTVTDILLSDKLPSGYSYISHEVDKGTYDEGEGLWNIDSLLEGEIASLTIRAHVKEQGNFLNIASLEASDPVDTNEGNNRAEISVTPNCLEVFNIVTPNGDGINDTFKIACVEKYPNNHLRVFNRWGGLVYEVRSYKNTWDGEANVRGAINRESKLPAGTYYYVLDLGEQQRPINGWVYIGR